MVFRALQRKHTGVGGKEYMKLVRILSRLGRFDDALTYLDEMCKVGASGWRCWWSYLSCCWWWSMVVVVVGVVLAVGASGRSAAIGGVVVVVGVDQPLMSVNGVCVHRWRMCLR